MGPGGTLGRHSTPNRDDNMTDADDEILESLVKTATAKPGQNEPRLRKKARYGDRKSCPGGTLGRHSTPNRDDNMTDADDEILESLVKTATAKSGQNEPRLRKKARYGDRKSLRRTLKSGLDLSEEERRFLRAMSS
ncbi:FH1/FH2 domain-containing protein 3-like isoform X3 [Ornithodoros turicata]|uniref:FH1/FH2 domain-containing protein 3-like isoform X3 n=1 Tax=Ornithodoros turicata TaxID=34597 RepID=UPI003139E734